MADADRLGKIASIGQDLITTQRYMHLSPAAIEGAIRLLEQPDPQSAWRHVGDDQAATR